MSSVVMDVFWGGEVASCNVLKRLSLKASVKCRRFNFKCFGESRLLSNGNSVKMLKESSAYYFISSYPKIYFGCNVWMRDCNSNSSAGYHCHIFKILKRFGMPHCHEQESVERVSEGRGDEEVLEIAENEASFESKGYDEISGEKETEIRGVDELQELLRNALNDLEAARLNRKMYENEAQRRSEAAIALKDKVANALNNVSNILVNIHETESEEEIAKDAVQKATMALSLAEARLRVVVNSVNTTQEKDDSSKALKETNSAYLVAQQDINVYKNELASCEAELSNMQKRKEELQKEMARLSATAEEVKHNASKAEEEVANIMLLTEKAVAYELEAAHHANKLEIALQRVEKSLSLSKLDGQDSTVEATISEDVSVGSSVDETIVSWKTDEVAPLAKLISKDPKVSDDNHKEKALVTRELLKETEVDVETLKTIQSNMLEMQKKSPKMSSPFSAPKALLKKSSRFFSASFFSYSSNSEVFTLVPTFHGIVEMTRTQLPKLVFGSLLMGAGIVFYVNWTQRGGQKLVQTRIITTGEDEVSTTAHPLVRQKRELHMKMKKLMELLPYQSMSEEEASLCDVLWLLLASVIFVPIFQKIPGGSPVLGYLAAGILIGPYGLSIIRNVHETKTIAEFGVVFLLFNIGLELSVERLSSMKKYVFGLGSAQVLVTAVAVGLLCHYVGGLSGTAAIVIGNGLALSSTAVVLQVLHERGETTSRYGRATFSVLLFQDLAVVVLLILIPLISPSSSKGEVGFQAISEALGLAALKAIVAISVIIVGGRVLLRPIYKKIAENKNPDVVIANTLLVVLGTSLFTAKAGLSMDLGAFLAGLLLAETEFSLQVESDIAPFRGILLGLFFVTVGMSINPKLLASNFSIITGTMGLLIIGKIVVVALVGKVFGLSMVSAIRVGLLLAPGGEFAFVAFGEAVNQGIMSSQLSSLLFLVVGVSMALTPWLAAGGQLIASQFELNDVQSLLPTENETDDLHDHIIICGFGRIGQIIAQLLSERLIPFVALDLRSDRVALGRSMELPVYFGDAGSQEVLHKVGAGRACAVAVTLDSPGANYRTVWALSKHFPNLKTFVRAHDVDNGVNLEKAGATAVVPEILEPSLQLAAATLAQTKLSTEEIAASINRFRSRHLSELIKLLEASGFSLGYGFSQVKPKSQPSDSPDDNQTSKTI